MTQRALVVGAMGMLGREVLAELRSVPSVDARGTYNVAQPPTLDRYVHFSTAESNDALRELVRGHEIIINCVVTLASTLRDASAEKVLDALNVNSVFPRRLSAVADELGARVIHISSDAVFSGRGGAPYSEDSIPDPADLYGTSKLLGESHAPSTLCIRTSIVGRDPTYHRGLLEWFLSQPDGAQLQGYTNHLWQGVTTKQLARTIAHIVKNGAFDDIRQESAVHHFCPNPALSKFELLEAFGRVFKRRIDVRPVVAPEGVDRRMRTTYSRLVACHSGDESFESALASMVES